MNLIVNIFTAFTRSKPEHRMNSLFMRRSFMFQCCTNASFSTPVLRLHPQVSHKFIRDRAHVSVPLFFFSE